MSYWRRLVKKTFVLSEDENFLGFLKLIESVVSKVLSIAMVLVIVVAIVDLGIFLVQNIFTSPTGFYNKTLIQIFGLFLNVLIALELLENITAYLKKHVIQVELVIVTSLIAVARKIIIFDFSKASGIDLIGLATAIFSLSISYWLIRSLNNKPNDH